MTPLVTMRRALEDPDLFGKILAGDTWAAWRIVLIAAMGEELTAAERETWRALTGREREPGERAEELWGIVGRRGGKTRAISALGAYLAALVDYGDILAPGERASLPIMSASTWQALKAKQYLTGIFATVPALGKLVEGETADTIFLKTRVDIEVRPASFRTARGGTSCAAIADEAAFWRSDTSANPDKEILDAIRPSLATTGGLLAVISSPYARRGEVWNAFRRDYGAGADPRVIVVKAASRIMNPSLPASVVERALQRDHAAASAEYLAEFRTDVEAFIDRAVVEAAVVPGRHELPKIPDVFYSGFVDPSGGSQDAMTLAIAHREGETCILDCVREVRPPFSPASVVADFASVLKGYGLRRVTGDRWGGEFVREQFRDHAIEYEISERTKSELYKELLPLMNSKRVELMEHRTLVAQLAGLERRIARGGRDSIDHAPGQHDDVINAAAGALVGCKTRIVTMIDVL